MTRPLFIDDELTALGGVRERTTNLERRPNHQMGGSGDRAIDYLWAGPKLQGFTRSFGIGIEEDFNTWTRDTTIDFGGYLTNGSGSLNDQVIFGAPLGPRWSTWQLEFYYAQGPDYGDLSFEFATTPFYRSEAGIGPFDPFDIEVPTVFGADLTFIPTHYTYVINGYFATERYNQVQDRPYDTFRITGEDGAMLTTITGGGHYAKFDSGDNTMMWFRIYVSGKNAASSGYRAKLQGFRVVRVGQPEGKIT